MGNVLCLQTSMSLVGHPSQFLWRPACRLQFPEGYICNQQLVCWQRNYWKSVFWPAGNRTNVKVLQNVDNSDLKNWNCILYVNIQGHDMKSRQWPKSRYTAKITVITAIVNSWFSYSPRYMLSSCVCLSQAGTVPKWLSAGSRKQCHMIAPRL